VNYDDPTVMPTAPINGASKSDRFYSGVAGSKKANPIPVSKTTAPLTSAGMVPVKRKSTRKLF
jgi:hypothetical protein